MTYLRWHVNTLWLPAQFSAQGLRSAYLTEAGNTGVRRPKRNGQSPHRSVQQASRYDNTATRLSGRAARLR